MIGSLVAKVNEGQGITITSINYSKSSIRLAIIEPSIIYDSLIVHVLHKWFFYSSLFITLQMFNLSQCSEGLATLKLVLLCTWAIYILVPGTYGLTFCK